MGKRARTIIILLLLAMSIAPINPTVHRANASDLIVSGTQVIEDQVVHVNGSIIVKSGGTLILRNATLILDMASQCQSNITVEAGGTLIVEDGSNITTNSTLGYQILVSGVLNVTNSAIEYVGGCSPGIEASGPNPHLYFSNSTLKYTGSWITVVSIHADEDSNTSTTGELVVDGLYLTSAPDQYVYNLFSIGGDTVFRINRLNTTDPSVKIAYGHDISITYIAAALVTAPNYINNSDLHSLYASFQPGNLDISITNTTITSYTYIQGTITSNATISGSRLNGTVTLTSLNLKLENTTVGSGTLRLQGSNVIAENLTILNPSNAADGAIIVNLASANRTVLLRDVKVEGLENAAYAVRYGIWIYSLYDSNNITILRASIKPSPGEKTGGIYISDNRGAPIAIRDSVIPGITFNYNRYYYYAMNLYLSNVSTLDGKPIVIVRDTSGASLTGSYGQVLVYNSSNINIRNLVFDSAVPGPIAILHSWNITLVNINITRQPYIYGVKIMDSENIALRNLYINGSTVFPKLEGVQAMNSTVTITRAFFTGSTMLDAPYGGTITIRNSNIINTDATAPAITLLRNAKLVLDTSNITSSGGGVYSISSDPTVPVCRNITIIDSNILTWTYAVKAHYTIGAVITGSNITKTAGSTDTQTLVDLASDSAQSVIVRDTIIENKAVEQPVIVQLSYKNNMNFTGNKVLGEADVGLKIQSFSNDTGYKALVASNQFAGQKISVSLSSSVGVTIVNNTIKSEPGYPGGIFIPYISFATIDYARHDIRNNTIDDVPIVYLDSATGNITNASQIIALNSTALVENLTLTGRPGMIQAYLSKITVKNTSIVVEDYADNYPVIRDWLDSTLILENTTITANAPSGYLVYLASGTDDHSRLVMDRLKFTGTVYKAVYEASISADPVLEIRDSVFQYNGSIQGLIQMARERLLVVADSEFNTSVPNVFYITGGDSALFTNVYFHSPQPGSIIRGYAVTLSNIYSLTLESVEFQDVRGAYLSNIHSFYFGDTSISTSDSYAGGALFTVWGLDGIFYKPTITHTRDLAIDLRSGTGNIISPIMDNSTWTNTDPLYGWAVLQANGGALRVAGLNATSIGGEPLRITGGTLEAHQGIFSRNPGYGLTVRGGTANVTSNYWGTPDGPNVTTSGADSVDPEEIYYQNGTGTLYYSPYLGGSPSDTSPPDVNITAPAAGEDVHGLIDVNMTYSDDYGVMVVIVFLNDSVAGILYPPAGTVKVDTSKFPDGQYILRVVAYDWAGNSAEKSVVINVKNYHPSARILEPEDGDLVGGYVKVYIYIYDDNLENWTLEADDTVVWTGIYTGYFTISWDSSRFPDGSHILKLEAWDKDGNYDSDNITVLTDNTDPNLAIGSPGNNSMVKGVVSLTFTIIEDHPDTYQVYVNSSLYDEGPAVNGTITVNVDTTAFQDGPYTVTVAVNDTVGNENSTSIRLVFDNTEPQVVITNPQNGSIVSGTVDVNVTSSDEYNVTWTAIYINGTLVYNATGPGPHVYEWNTTEAGSGLYNITAVASDTAGNTNTTTVLVTVAATPVPESPLVPLVAAIVAVLVAAWVGIKRIF